MNIPDSAMTLLKTIQQSGYEIYLVGGCVRDFILGETPHDWDMCTNAKTPELIEILTSHGYKLSLVGAAFGTVTVMCNDNEYEITTYRADGEYTDNRRPDSIQLVSSIDKDLERRDFTINAMAYDPVNDKFVDMFNGRQHLKEKKLVAVGEADKRFKEDALRILRALRFAIKYDLEIEQNTFDAMKNNVELLDNVSRERVTQELKKTLTCGRPITKLFMQCDFVVKQIIPELESCFKFDQHSSYHKHDVYEHILNVVDGCNTDDFEIKLAALLHDIGKPHALKIDDSGYGHFKGHPEISYEMSIDILNKRLRLTGVELENTLALIRYHGIMPQETDASVKRAINRFNAQLGADKGIEMMHKWFILKQSDLDDHINLEHKKFSSMAVLSKIVDKIESENQCFKLKDLAINGNDLIKELGLKPGKQIGLILNALLDEVIDETTKNEKESLIKRACELNKEKF